MAPLLVSTKLQAVSDSSWSRRCSWFVCGSALANSADSFESSWLGYCGAQLL